MNCGWTHWQSVHVPLFSVNQRGVLAIPTQKHGDCPPRSTRHSKLLASLALLTYKKLQWAMQTSSFKPPPIFAGTEKLKLLELKQEQAGNNNNIVKVTLKLVGFSEMVTLRLSELTALPFLLAKQCTFWAGFAD
ncbi:hypothetical protein H0E87_001592 [Populus deltoides]|uniref:Uncharacterized protein n=1 Tax=Populus deltoides TaxID=3696 RepID=A0A8T2ZS86_POPDE|nr:hypothetical protein H0E87_001592 [Populus deltoides]